MVRKAINAVGGTFTGLLGFVLLGDLIADVRPAGTGDTSPGQLATGQCMSVGEFNYRANELAQAATEQKPEVFSYHMDWRNNGSVVAAGFHIFKKMSQHGTLPCADLKPLYNRWMETGG